MKKYIFSIDEFGDPDAEFYTLYASFRLYYEIKKALNKGSSFSVEGMAAYNFLMELQEQDPVKFAQAAKEFDSVYGKIPAVVNVSNMICVKKLIAKTTRYVVELTSNATGDKFYLNGQFENFETPITIDLQEAFLFETMLAATNFLSNVTKKLGTFIENYDPKILWIEHEQASKI